MIKVITSWEVIVIKQIIKITLAISATWARDDKLSRISADKKYLRHLIILRVTVHNTKKFHF